MKRTRTILLNAGTVSAMVIGLMLGTGICVSASGGTLKGKVTESKTGQPVVGATVAIERTAFGAKANLDGVYEIDNLPAGNYTLRFSSVGYAALTKSVSLQAEEVLTVDAALAESGVAASEVVVSASRYEQSKFDAPVTTSVITAKMIEAQPVQNLDRLLESVPGVDMTRAGGIGSSNVQIRGSNSYAGGGLGTRIMMLYDGFPMNSADANSIDLTGLSMDNVDRIEVVKGASSALYGSAAMGGIINAINTMPQQLQVKARFTNGVYDRPPSGVSTRIYPGNTTPYFYNGSVSVGDNLGQVAYDASYSRLNDDGYREATQMTVDNVKFKVRYDLSATQSLQLSSLMNWSTGGIPQAWIQRGDAYANPNIETNYLADDIKDNQSQLVGLLHSALVGSSARLETRAYFNRNAFVLRYYPTYDARFGDVQKYQGGDRGVYDPNNQSTFNYSDARRFGVSSMLDIAVGSSHRIVTGIEGTADDVRSSTFSNSSSNMAGLFVQDEIALLPKLKVTLGLRYDFNQLNPTEVTYKDQVSGNTVTEPLLNRQQQQVSPRLAAVYTLNDETALRASVARSFRAPSVGERFVTDAGIFKGNPNPALNGERMTGAELGIFKRFSSKFSVDAAVYFNQYSNLIEAVNISPNSTLIFQYVNVADATIAGAEFAFTAQPIEQLGIRLNYNYMRARGTLPANVLAFGTNPDPEQLSYRPDHNISFNLNLTFAGLLSGGLGEMLAPLSLSYSGRYISQINSVRVFIDENRKDYPGNFLVMDAGARYTLFEKFNLIGSVRNLTNTQYEELEKYRAPGRSFYLGIEFGL